MTKAYGATTYSEENLVTLLKEKDNKAFSYLYDNYSGALFTVIKKIVAEQDAASDVLQESFVHIWKKIESYDSTKGRLFTWMMNISKNAAIDMLRSKGFKNSKCNARFFDNIEMNSIAFVVHPQTDYINLQKTFAHLKCMHRRLLDLSYIKGYTHEEIAKIELMPLGTVKSRIRIALLQLKQFLEMEAMRVEGISIQSNYQLQNSAS